MCALEEKSTAEQLVFAVFDALRGASTGATPSSS